MTATSDALLIRLDAVERHLGTLAAAELRGRALTDADAATGERWEAGQVWAHIGEFAGYWLAEAGMVARDFRGEPVPFGRTKTDPGRIAAIEHDRAAPAEAMLVAVRDDITATRGFVKGMGESESAALGVHQTLGAMTVTRIIEQFIVEHLEEHAEQLAGLTRR